MTTATKVQRREFLQLADTFDAVKHDIAGFYISEKLDGGRRGAPPPDACAHERREEARVARAMQQRTREDRFGRLVVVHREERFGLQPRDERAGRKRGVQPADHALR